MKLLSPRAFYYILGKKGFFQYLLFAGFLIFFYLPLMNLCMLAFADKYEVPAIIPQEFGFKWWGFVLEQRSLVSSISVSFFLAIIVTFVSLAVCIPAAYALARYEFFGKRIFLLSFLLSNAYPRMGLYISIGILFYKLGLMGTLAGVVIIHFLNSMMFMTWIPSGAFRSVYRQQEESARDAGAGPIRTFFKVTLPLATPGIAVASVFTFLSSLEEAQGTLLVGFPQIKTMPVELYGVIMEYPLTAGPVLSLILIIPTVLVLFFMRKYINADSLSGGYGVK
ncbi:MULTISPECIES: ABC transporter permease subunit [Lacrimispora]|jgi:putative spermidine/putrescine transport system permease protein|uniref:ABC transporter permease n=1 Tax=Lacrimispora TaxID=2719231 RepID=UPI000BE2F70C|nr:ABC transporter permease subunit [Lacrimispora amygdalina]MDK2967366.1 putative spermidine/putrescine transport system permease protein [Lacrimispora sp.]